MSESQQFESAAAHVHSDQRGPHPDLDKVIARHLAHAWRKPVPEHTRRAADDALEWLQSLGTRRVVLDSYCGTGLSTSTLAKQAGDTAVIGIDKSVHRLERHVAASGNYRLFRAECEPFWRCLVEANVTVDKHWILYPNPWPKSGQLKRRVHGHPAFPLLKQLGGCVELRSNWRIYVEEFASACRTLGAHGSVDTVMAEPALTLFERKYAQGGQRLYRFQGQWRDQPDDSVNTQTTSGPA